MGAATAQISAELKHYGFFKTAHYITVRALNWIVPFKVLKCVKIEAVNPEFLEYPEEYRACFLTPEMLREFGRQPEYELPAAFLDHAFGKGDECFGFINGNVLAAYGWYSNRPTEVDWPGLEVRFDKKYIYMYKGFTHPDHRGKRLHAIGMTRALQAYLSTGYKGLVSYVEATNFASLKSCFRMGYEEFGRVYVIGLFNTYLIHCDRGCRSFGFRLATTKS